MEWKDQYKHPNWQRKRLEALESAGYQCQSCYDEETQLHVHHKTYIKGRKIWEYDLKELSVLCETCHADAHTFKNELQKIITSLQAAEGVPILVAVLYGFCRDTWGPCDIDAFDCVAAELYPRSAKLGELAATLGDILTTPQIDQMIYACNHGLITSETSFSKED